MHISAKPGARKGYTPTAQPNFFRFESERARWLVRSHYESVPDESVPGGIRQVLVKCAPYRRAQPKQ